MAVPVVDAKPQKRRSYRYLWIVLATFVVLYVVSYFLISRSRFEESKKYRLPGFWYLPVSMLGEENHTAWKVEFALTVFYSPMNAIDRAFFGGPGVCGEPLWGIGPKRR